MAPINHTTEIKKQKNVIQVPDITYLILTDVDGNKYRASVQQSSTITALSASRGGGIATVHGYRPTSGYVVDKCPVIDLQVITRFSTEALYKRRMAALSEIRYTDVEKFIKDDVMLAAMTHENSLTLFNNRKAEEVASMNKTVEGDRGDAHRQGHDRCYARIGRGVKINYVTEKVEGLMQPVLTDGLPTVASIMLSFLEISRVIKTPGEYKIVNSGAPVRMSNCINKMLNSKSVGIKMMSLKEDNFDRLVIDKQTYTADDVQGIPADVLDI